MELDNKIKMDLVFGDDIAFGNEFIKQLTIGDIHRIGEETLDEYLYPFCLIPEAIELPDELKEGYSIFEIYFIIDIINKMQNKQSEEFSMVEKLKLSLSFFFNTDDIVVYNETMKVFINHRTEINKDNFDFLCAILLTMCKSQKFEVKKDNLKGKSEEYIKRYKKHMERRKKYQDKIKKDDGLYRIVNAVRKYEGISHKELKTWTMWQVLDSYQTSILKEQYEHNLRMLTVVDSESAKKLDLKHWAEKLIIKSN